MEVNSNLSEKALQDYRLVQSAIAGDQHAYASLMERYRDTVFYMLLKMVKNRSDAEDLTIEAFGKAFKKLHQYTPDFAFSTWLFKIASNNCIDFLRKRRTSTISIDGQLDEYGETIPFTIKTDLPDPEEDLIRQQKSKHLHDVVSKLKPRYKELVTLRYFDELSYEEIAERMNLPIGTVKAQLFRARELLCNVLKSTQETL